MKWYTWALYIFMIFAFFVGSVGYYLDDHPGVGTFCLLALIVTLIFFIERVKINIASKKVVDIKPISLPKQRHISPYEHADAPSFTSHLHASSAPVRISVGVTTTVSEREPHVPVNIPRVDLPPAPSNGYMSCAKYQIKGTNPKTARINTRYVVAHNQEAVEKKMLDLGLENPVVSQVMPNRPATDRQLDFAKDLGARFPADVCLEDASSIIDRMYNHYYDERELEPLNYGFASYAQECDIQFSTFSHPDELLKTVVYHLPEIDKLTLYICAVSQSINGGLAINQLDPRKLPIYSRAKDISKDLLNDEKLMKSFCSRYAEDYLKPRKGTNIYNAIVAKL